MKDENVIRDKSKLFAIRCIRLYKYLCEEKREFVMSKQLLRSGTSIGANVREAIFGQSRSDFASKLCIAQKEAGETEYWIELLEATEYVSSKQSQSMLNDCREIIKLLQAITKTLYSKQSH